MFQQNVVLFYNDQWKKSAIIFLEAMLNYYGEVF
jgi:hypothetical protein